MNTTGLPLGLFEDAQYDDLSIEAAPGDVFVFYSDGISDAQNRAGGSFGDDQIEQIVFAQSGNSVEEIVNAIFSAVAAYSEGVSPFDDETAVVVKIRQ